jgi:hypothetical protein
VWINRRISGAFRDHPLVEIAPTGSSKDAACHCAPDLGLLQLELVKGHAVRWRRHGWSVLVLAGAWTGGEAVLKLRAVRMSADWQAYCTCRWQQEIRRNRPEYEQQQAHTQ